MNTTHQQGVHTEHMELAKLFSSVKVMGPPHSDKLMAIIEHLFTREEARIGAHMSFMHPRTTGYLAKKTGIQEPEAGSLLEEMCRKRTIIHVANRYILYPLIPGSFENILRTGDASQWHRRYAELINNLYNTGYLRDYFTRPVHAIRNIPVQRTLQEKSMVATPDLISELIEYHSDFAVFHSCPCRQSMHLTGHSCTHASPKDGCLTFGEFSKGIEPHGNGRTVSKSEMYDIVAERREKKLVFFTSNADPSLPTGVCTCCDCCCHALGIINKYNGKLAAPPNYIAAVDDDLCTHCGRCVTSCNTHAHSITDKKHAYNSEKCIGCGYCAAACKTNAISMALNNSYIPPSESYTKLILKMLPPVILMGMGIKLRRYFSRN